MAQQNLHAVQQQFQIISRPFFQAIEQFCLLLTLNQKLKLLTEFAGIFPLYIQKSVQGWKVRLQLFLLKLQGGRLLFLKLDECPDQTVQLKGSLHQLKQILLLVYL